MNASLNAQVDIAKIDRLIRLAIDPAASQEEARTSALIACRLLGAGGVDSIFKRGVYAGAEAAREMSPAPAPDPQPRRVEDMSRRLSTAEDVVDFALAGNARLTLRSTATGARFTYRIKSIRDDDSPHFVSLLTGADNETGFEFLGTIFQDGQYRRSRKSRIGADAKSAVAFAWVWGEVTAGAMPARCEAWHEGRCGACGRVLTVPASIGRGLGPDCASRSDGGL
jgi:Family of unknown function (DUF6011)